jgi:AraC family transcriptional regulator of adaptative response/methylated-DNA-[protein]-cysteine methyltransferase
MLDCNLDNSPTDHAYVKRALSFMSENWRAQPSLEAIASEVKLSPWHLQRVFTRWAGISPKAFLQALTLDHARAMLRDSASILDTAYEVGLSGPSRLHDLFVSYEGMTPGSFKSRGEGLTMYYAFHPSPFGTALIMVTEQGLSGLAFSDEGEERQVLAEMMSRWPLARCLEDSARTTPYASRIFNTQAWRPDRPLRVVLIGSDFEIRVWESLLRIPMGKAASYSDIAAHLGKPKAARAVGAAVGKNPVCFVVPCHRVLEKSGGLGGYHWGLTL